MRICLLFDDDYPWDVRVEKIGRTLVAAGHTVLLTVRNTQRLATRTRRDGMHLRRMRPWRFLPPDLDAKLMFPAFFSPRWLSHLGSVVKRGHCDLIIVRDLPLVLTALAIGRLAKIPVVLDMAENYPAALKAFRKHGDHGPIDRLIRNPGAADWIESLALPRCDHIFVVTDENRRRILAKGAAPESVSVVANTPDLAVFNGSVPPAKVRGRYKDDFVLMYVGEISAYRGLDTVVDALPWIRRAIPNIRLTLLGKGDGVAEIKARAHALGVGDCLDLAGFLPLAALPAHIACADLCLIPHHRNAHIDTTVPNKLFDYMAMAKPVLATDALPLKRILSHWRCGLTYRSGDVDHFAEKVIRFQSDDLRHQMGNRGRRAVLEKYNWTLDAEQLSAAIARLDLRLAAQGP